MNISTKNSLPREIETNEISIPNEKPMYKENQVQDWIREAIRANLDKLGHLFSEWS